MGSLKTIKSFIKSRFPITVKIANTVAARRDAKRPLRDVFSEIHTANLWGDQESVSGPGSRVVQTQQVRAHLPELAESLNMRVLMDAPCGDFNWMQHVDIKDAQYIGVDIVPKIIAANQKLYSNEKRSFVELDITREQLPQADLILCRDCFVHLSFKIIKEATTNFQKSNSVYLLTTNYPKLEQNRDIGVGDWRPINLEIAPFNFPPALATIVEDVEPAFEHDPICSYKTL